MSTSQGGAAPFNASKLDKLAAKFREEEQGSQLSLAKAGPGNLGQQPKLSFRSFTVANARVAVSPDSSFRLLSEALLSAKRSLTVYVYNISAPYLIAILKAKVQAGIKVRVMVDSNDGGADELAALAKAGVDVRAAPSSGTRKVFTVCHQKFVVVDGKTLVLQSANWATSAIPQIKKFGDYKPGNREWLIRVDDVDVALWFEDLFQKDFDIPASAGLKAFGEVLTLPSTLLAAALFTAPGQLFDIQAATKPVKLFPLISPVNYQEEVVKALKLAKKRILIQQQYIQAGNGVNELLEVVHAKAATCEVRIIVSPKFTDAWLKTVKTLKAAGLDSKLRAQNLTHVIHCHNKGVVIDDDQVVVSSTNWSENSITRAREAGFLVGSKELTGYFASVFDLDWNEGIAPSQLATTSVELSSADMV